MPWTTEQLDAIRSDGNLIVSAAAGAGKTAVLTERIAMRIIGGIPVERMLVLTFTRAAAAEMKARITKRLAMLADEADTPDAQLYLREQARAVGNANISTVHAFCARVLRRHYHVLGLAPKSRILDETESAAIVAQVQDALLSALAAEESPAWRTLLSAFGGEQPAWDAVYTTYTFLQAQPEPLGWLEEAVVRYASDEALATRLDEVTAACKAELRLGLKALTAARDALAPDMAAATGVLDEELMRCRALMLMPDYDAYRQGLLDMEFGTLRFARGTPDAEKAPVRGVRDAFKKLVREQRGRLRRTAAEECEAMRAAGTVLSALRDVVCAFSGAFAAEKRARAALDYNDLEHLTLDALRMPGVMREYREKFLLIAVDEYQDSNRVQEALLNAIRREDNLFLVGDVKQSIYRFRQAEPGLFLEKLSAFSGAAGRRIDLNRNFRSAPEVLAAVNDTFCMLMTRDAGEMDYDARAMLAYGGEQPHGGAELHVIARETDGSGDALESAADAEVEARLAAARIRELMEAETPVDPATDARRTLTYADFAVLLRSTTHAQLVAQTLSQCGVPCYAQLNGGYFDAVEVQVLLNLLRVIDNRRQDVPLISVLLSSIGDFTAEELLRLRVRRREGTFFDALLAARETDGKVAAFFRLLDRYREESRFVTIEHLIGLLLDETGFYEEMGAGFNGRQRQANLDALLTQAHAFERTGARGVWRFLRHMDLARSGASIGAAQTASANVVKILTIHKSKGLEFPVVFLLQLGARFNLQNGPANLQMHTKLGLGLRCRGAADGVMHDTALRQTIRKTLRSEQLAEELRVLYVAMTRAKSRLILIGCMKNAQERMDAAWQAPTPFAVLLASTPLAWLLMARRGLLQATLHARGDWLDPPPADAVFALPAADHALLETLKTHFAWEYPFASAVALPAKASVSRVAVAGASLPLELDAGAAAKPCAARMPAFDLPAFLSADTRTPAFFGTAMHAAVQHLPLDIPPVRIDVGAFLDSLVSRARMTPEQAEAADADALRWFVASKLFARIQKSPRVERELAFGYEMDADALFATDAQERVLLQGMIDCCFIENDGWVLVDYKTDRVPQNSTPEATAARHCAQLALYAAALAQLTGLPVREQIVVLLRAREIVPI